MFLPVQILQIIALDAAIGSAAAEKAPRHSRVLLIALHTLALTLTPTTPERTTEERLILRRRKGPAIIHADWY